MEKTKKIVTIAVIATLISVLNFSQSNAYFSEMGWDRGFDNFKANAAASETTRKYYLGGDKLKYECIFDSRKNGVCREFHKNGHVAKETKCTNNKKSTAYKTFFKNGELASEGRYTNGQKNGLFKQYYWRSSSALSNRQKSSESSYKDGFRHGLSKEFSPDGTVTWSQNYN